MKIMIIPECLVSAIIAAMTALSFRDWLGMPRFTTVMTGVTLYVVLVGCMRAALKD